MKLLDQLSSNEKVLWYGKKAKGVSVLESIFNPLLPFALLWALVDGFIIFGATAANKAADAPKGLGIGLFGFFAIHLMPVWMYIGGVLTSAIKAGHTDYCVTDKAVYIQQGVLSSKVFTKPYTNMITVTCKQGFFDKIFHTGDVVISCGSAVNMPGSNVRVNGRPVKSSNDLTIDNISDYQHVMQVVRELQEAANADAYSDAPSFRGQFTAQMSPDGGMMQDTASYQQQRYAQQQAAFAQQQFAQSTFGQPAAQQPMFSDPQRGFSATSGSFVAGGIPQPTGFDQPTGFNQPTGFDQPTGFNQPALQSASFIQPAPASQSFIQPTPLQQPTPAPAPQFPVPQQPKPAPAPVPQFSVPQRPQPHGFEMPKGFDAPSGFDMPDLVMPEPQSDFVDPTLSQAQEFRDPTLDYLDPNRPI